MPSSENEQQNNNFQATTRRISNFVIDAAKLFSGLALVATSGLTFYLATSSAAEMTVFLAIVGSSTFSTGAYILYLKVIQRSDARVSNSGMQFEEQENNRQQVTIENLLGRNLTENQNSQNINSSLSNNRSVARLGTLSPLPVVINNLSLATPASNPNNPRSENLSASSSVDGRNPS